MKAHNEHVLMIMERAKDDMQTAFQVKGVLFICTIENMWHNNRNSTEQENKRRQWGNCSWKRTGQLTSGCSLVFLLFFFSLLVFYLCAFIKKQLN